MKTVWLISQHGEEDYFLEGSDPEGKEVQITDEFWERYLAYDREKEYIVSKLHRLGRDPINNIA